jgi:exodeoxyribonuclease V gamma subunit
MLTVYRSNRMERLVDALADSLRTPPDDPAAAEWIAVQSQGLRSWLSQQLADRFGILANVRLPFPRGLIDRVFAWVLGDRRPELEPFDQSCLAWSIAAELPRLIERPEFEPVRVYLGGDRRDLKLHQLARAFAHTFDEYALYRPEMVADWEQGLPRDDWQAALWVAAGKRIRQRGRSDHVGAVARRAIEVLRDGERLADRAPQRIALFGISSLPPLYAEILAELARQIEIKLFLLSPSSRPDPDHPLLWSLGRAGRDFQSVLESRAGFRDAEPALYQDPVASGPPSLLTAIQSDVLAARDPGSDDEAAGLRRSVATDDRSIQIHSCHGPMRQVEVLKDQLLALFDDRELDLRLEDVLVATPELDRFAPLVDALFGRELPHTISGRGIRSEAPVVDGLLALLEMVGGRAEASTVLDFVAREPVLARAGLAEADLDLAARWVVEAGVRWGVDEEHRARLEQPSFGENTWRFALDRLLLGYAMPGRDRDLFGGVLPYDDIEGTAGQVLGRFATLVDELLARVTGFEQPRSVPRWTADLRDALALFFDGRGSFADQHATVHAALARIEAAAERAGFAGEIDAAVLLAELMRVLDDGALGAPLSGGIRVAGLLPLRGIPFRVVCLLGLSDGTLPRPAHAPGFDRMAAQPRAGDRSPRDDDRSLFLEALLSARERLIITYTGQDPHSNEPLPPAVLVSELLDAVDEGFAAADGAETSGDQLTVRHPLQPFARRYFEQGPERDPRLFSYYRGEHLQGAGGSGRRIAPPAFVTPGARLPLDPGEIGSVRLVDLERFLKAPVAAFLERRLGVRFDRDDREIDDREPFGLAGLAYFRAGERLLSEALGGGDVSAHYPLLRAAGVLPLGAPGRAAFDELAARVDLYRAELGQGSGAPLSPLEVAVDVRTSYGATRVVGVLDDLTEGGLVRLSFGRKYAYRLLQLWLGHVVLACSGRLGKPCPTVWIGRSRDGVERVEIKPVAGDPHALLADLVDLYWAGQQGPLPLFPASSLELAYKLTSPHRRQKETQADVERQALKNAWGKWNPDGYAGVREGADPALARVFGATNPLDSGGADDPLGFKAVALRAFGPLLGHLERFTMGRC